jgi:hypothetical protein
MLCAASLKAFVMDDTPSIPPDMQEAIERARKAAGDPVKRPQHYTRGEVEVIDYIEQVVKDYPPEVAYHIGNVLKYLSRAPHKGAMQQDLEKAEWYLRRAINRVAQIKA